ncbi:hypothetical protein [Streptomyces sp. NPDC057381]|uniref:hypothetical protein n=1 Tax=Streptomyces sp. NPDC057381 TaxID=3346111 RepID=UPI0036319C7A
MRQRARGEYEWALEVVGRLQVPERASLDETIALVARQVGRPLAVVQASETPGPIDRHRETIMIPPAALAA